MVAVLFIYKEYKDAFPDHWRDKREAVFPFKSWSTVAVSALLPKKAFGFLPKLHHWYFMGCLPPFCWGAFLILFTQLVLMVTTWVSEIEIYFYEKFLTYLYHANSIPSAVCSMVELYITSQCVISHYQNFSSQKREPPGSQ